MDPNEDFSGWFSAPVVRGEYRTPVTEFSKRNIFTVLLKGLKPQSVYSFRVIEPNWDNSRAQIYTYNTFDMNNITIADGGDIGNNEIATQMIENVISKADVDLIMVGGDTAYDQNAPSCFRAWDYLLKSLPIYKHNFDKKTVRIVPILFSTGNHDLGMSTLDGNVLRHNSHEPVFKHYFPQNTDNGKIPKLLERKPYFAQNIGKFIIIKFR